VASSWVATSRYHLFQSVAVELQGLSSRDHRLLHELLQSPQNTFASSVRSLVVEVREDRIGEASDMYTDFTMLKSVGCLKVTLYDDLWLLGKSLVSNFPHLTSLAIVFGNCEDLYDIIRMVASCACLESLTIDSLTIDNTVFPLDSPVASLHLPLTLRGLRIESFWFFPFVEWCRLGPSMPLIEELFITEIRDIELNAITQLLCHLVSSISTLELSMVESESEGMSLTHLLLRRNLFTLL
jgi:hypothetical protein